MCSNKNNSPTTLELLFFILFIILIQSFPQVKLLHYWQNKIYFNLNDVAVTNSFPASTANNYSSINLLILLIFTNLVFQILNSSYTHLLFVIYSIYFKYRSNPQSKPVIRIYKSLINLLNSNKNKNYSK